MAEVSKNPIKKYERGLPCMFGQAVGRILGESEEGSWGNIDGERMWSIPLFGSPHGTVVKTGVLYLSEITEEGIKKLKDYEADATMKGIELYGGRLNDVTLWMSEETKYYLIRRFNCSAGQKTDVIGLTTDINLAKSLQSVFCDYEEVKMITDHEVKTAIEGESK